MERVIEIITASRIIRLPPVILDEIRRVALNAVHGVCAQDLIINKHLDADGRMHYTVDLDETPGR